MRPGGRRWRNLQQAAALVSALAAAALAPGAAEAAEAGLPAPRLERQGAWLRLRPAATWLAAPEIRQHLETGLTTTLLITVKARDGFGGVAQGAGRADVRYDLWDEVYHVAVGGMDGRVERIVAPDFEALLAWWTERRVTLLAGQRLRPSAVWRVRATLSVVPFSQSEQLDAQRWLSRSLTAEGSRGSDELASADEQGTSALDELFKTLVATSIGRRSLSTWDWTVTVAPPAAPPAGRPTP